MTHQLLSSRSLARFFVCSCVQVFAAASGLAAERPFGKWESGSVSDDISLTYQVYTPEVSAADFSAQENATTPGQKPEDQNSPLIVVLAGCSQGTRDFNSITGFTQFADKNNVTLLFPEQSSRYNALRCWNWFDLAQQSRSGSESKAVLKMIDQTMSSHNINPRRVYLVGFSAGAALANIMSHCYPERFAASLIHSGLAFGSATSMTDAYTAMATGSLKSTEVMGQNAFQCGVAKARKVVPTMIVHGLFDFTVNSKNASQIIDQEINVYERLAQLAPTQFEKPEPAGSSTVSGSKLSGTLQKYELGGRPVLQTLLVNGMAHAWSGGNVGLYSEPGAPDALGLAWQFFSAIDQNPAE